MSACASAWISCSALCHPLVYLIASNLDVKMDEVQQILETEDIQKVLQSLTVQLNTTLETLELSKKIQQDVKEGMDKRHRSTRFGNSSRPFKKNSEKVMNAP